MGSRSDALGAKSGDDSLIGEAGLQGRDGERSLFQAFRGENGARCTCRYRRVSGDGVCACCSASRNDASHRRAEPGALTCRGGPSHYDRSG